MEIWVVNILFFCLYGRKWNWLNLGMYIKLIKLDFLGGVSV